MATYGIDYGMTPQGFIPKRMDQILDSFINNLGGIADPETGEFPYRNLADDSLLQQLLAIMSEGLCECWEATYDGAVQFDPLKNSGAGQAGTVQLNAMLLKPGAYSVVDMELFGKPGTVIPQGSRIATATSVKDGVVTTAQVYLTQKSVVLDERGVAEVRAECTVKGAFDPEPGTVVHIQTPIAGWLNAANVQTSGVGSRQETEEELRQRQQRSTSLTSYRQIDAIYAAVRNVPGVTFCRAYQNDRVYPYDKRGIPFKEVAVVAEGGDPREIANALFLRFPVGVVGYGNTMEVFYDQQGVSYAICFSRPVEVPIIVKLDLVVTTRSEFPDFGAHEIRQQILSYASYGGKGSEEGFPPGTDISCSRLYTPINRIPGHRVARLSIARQMLVGEPEFKEDSIPIAWNQVGQFSADRILINVTSAEDED